MSFGNQDRRGRRGWQSRFGPRPVQCRQNPTQDRRCHNQADAEDAGSDHPAEVFRDGVATRAEVEALFALHSSCAEQCAEWPDFFVEAVTDYIVTREKPVGYISEDSAAWLSFRTGS